jgi:pyruvate,water dikinase
VLDASGAGKVIDSVIRDLTAEPAPDFAQAAGTIRNLLRAIEFPPGVRQDIHQRAASLGAGPLIVRSSACGEDGLDASFAGQLDSIADVCPGPDVVEAVVSVWSSRWSPRALAYEAAKRVPLRAIGVIVQQQIVPRWSGVLFTQSPANAAQMLMEFCGGMAEALVAGRENPGRISITRQNLRWSLDAEPGRALEGVHLLVNDECLEVIGRTALAIERGFGRPQDIEWAIDAGQRLWIVQTRPITARGRGRTSPRSGPAKAPVVWSNANVNENFPEPITPFLYSVARDGYYHYFRNLGRAFGMAPRRLEAMETPLRHIVGVHGARMYYNLTSIHAVLRSAPFGDQLAASFNQFVGAEATNTPAAVPFSARASRTVRDGLDVARMLFQITRHYCVLERRVARFERRVDRFAARTHPSALPGRTVPELLDHLRAFLHIRRHQWNDAALADAGSMVCYGALQRLLARAFPEDDQQALHNSLLKALPDLVSSRPAIELWRLAQMVRSEPGLLALFAGAGRAGVAERLTRDARFADFQVAFTRFQEDWGFRCSGELMLTVPSFQEGPSALIGIIASYLSSDAESPLDVLERQAAERTRETARVRRELRRRRVFRWMPRVLQPTVVLCVLRWTQACIAMRERARLKQALLYARLRRIVLQIGACLTADGRLAAQDDIFFLTADEIDTLLSGHSMLPGGVRELTAMRRRQHAQQAALRPPDALTLLEGEYFSAASLTPHRPPGDATCLTGVGACGGTATGRAAVLADVKDSARLRSGDVLVTRQTDPGWGPVFPLISGLVVERGGMLSHGAIIAREFGIPSVVGVSDATRRIPSGSLITVDGDRGRIEIAGAAS